MNSLIIFYIYFHDANLVPIHVAEIVSELAKRGHRLHLFTCTEHQRFLKKTYPVKIKIHNLWTLKFRYVSEIFFIIFLLPYLFICSLKKRPNVIYSRHSASSLIAVMIGKMLKIPCLLEVNDILLDKLTYTDTFKLKRIWIRFYTFITYRLADVLLPVTKEIGNYIEESYKIGKEKIITIPNGVNIERFNIKNEQIARKNYKIGNDAKIILSLGSLFPWAGMDVLISAAKQVLENFPNTIFLIGSGEEPYLSNIKRKIVEQKLVGNFKFLGFIPWNQAAEFISLADICVAPFVFKHNRSGICSLRVLSYMACGKPVIGSDITGLGDLLEYHKIGLSFSMGNHDELASKIVHLLKNENKMMKMGKKARVFVCNNFSWEIIVKKLESLFFELTLNNPS